MFQFSSKKALWCVSALLTLTAMILVLWYHMHALSSVRTENRELRRQTEEVRAEIQGVLQANSVLHKQINRLRADAMSSDEDRSEGEQDNEITKPEPAREPDYFPPPAWMQPTNGSTDTVSEADIMEMKAQFPDLEVRSNEPRTNVIEELLKNTPGGMPTPHQGYDEYGPGIHSLLKQ